MEGESEFRLSSNNLLSFLLATLYIRKPEVNSNYISSTNIFLEDLGKDIDYFNQTVEADAYGREIAARLEKIYPTETVSNLFSRITSNDIQDDYIKKIIGVYKDPRISDNANRAFFRSIYDFLKEEKEESV